MELTFWDFTLVNGREVFVNPHAIAYFEPNDNDTSITFVTLTSGDLLQVKEYYKHIWDRYHRATAESNR